MKFAFFSIDKMCIIISLREVHWTRTTLKSWLPGLLVLRILWPRQHFVHDFLACWASAHHGPHQPIQPYPFSAFFSPIGWVHLCQLALFVWVPCSSHAILDDRRGGSHNSAVLNVGKSDNYSCQSKGFNSGRQLWRNSMSEICECYFKLGHGS